MSAIEAIILGAVQGLTEFLPVSSSGHLILAREVLGLNTEGGLAVDAVLQLATALAVLIYFRSVFMSLARDLVAYFTRRPVGKEAQTLLFALVLGTIPAVVTGLFLENAMETVFRSASLVAWMLIAGSILFLIAEHVAKRIQPSAVTVRKGILIGLFQCLALIPGVSRSGATISGGLLLGLTRPEAARFGFLLAFPIIFGSGLKKLFELSSEGSLHHELVPLILGFLTAFLVGLAAIHFLMQFLRTHTLVPFVVYRLLLAAVIFAYV